MLVSRNPIIALTTVGVLVVLLRTVPVSRSEETRLEIRTAAGDNRAAEEPGWVKFHVRDKRLLLDNRQLDRNVIRVISTFVELQELCLIRCGLVDEDIIHLSKLTNLEILNLSENDITDSGGAHVGRLQKLVYVDLSKTKVGDRTVEALGACGELTGLQLESTQVHGDSLACLSNCRNLRRLSLRRDRIDARYWPGIGTLASLRNLDISLTNLSGSDLQFLAPLVNLQELSVTKLRDVQDESIEVVSELALLTHLSIGHTRITNKGEVDPKVQTENMLS